MNNYCKKCDSQNPYEPCEFVRNPECDKYKEKADELYMKAGCVHDQAKKFLCESKELDNQAKELERKAKEICAQANIAFDKARKADSEGDNLLDLASFYASKAAECAKNESNSYMFRPTCNMNVCYCKENNTGSCGSCNKYHGC